LTVVTSCRRTSAWATAPPAIPSAGSAATLTSIDSRVAGLEESVKLPSAPALSSRVARGLTT
jgi:hypothetical protein